MYPGGLGSWAGIVGLVIILWLGVLTWTIWQDRSFLKKLFPGPLKKQGEGRDFRGKLEEILQELAGLEDFKKESSYHLQKVALKRYNPYHDTGGDQSFSVALLDGKGDGVVITSLHSRAGTRVFAKPIKDGREDKFQLSQEEQETVAQALKKN